MEPIHNSRTGEGRVARGLPAFTQRAHPGRRHATASPAAESHHGTAAGSHPPHRLRPHWHHGHAVRIERARHALAQLSANTRAQRGDTLIEVLISALVVAIVAVGTVTGFATTNKVSALGRDRSQAQTLAEKDEERLRGEPISDLESLIGREEKTAVKVSTQEFTVTSTVKEVNEAGVSDCTVEVPTAYYFKTISKVTWKNMGKNAPVVETGSIAPPAGASLIVRIEGPEKGEGVNAVTVTATGPGESGKTYETVTNSEGCALFGPFESGGEYVVDAHKAGYVDPNWFSHLSEDPYVTTTWNLLTNVATKASYRFAPAGSITATLSTAKPTGVTGSWNPTTTASNVVVATNEGMHPAERTLRANNETASTFSSEEPGVFPFTYSIYAGTCTEDEPKANGASENPSAQVKSGERREVNLVLPALVVRVYKGETEVPSNYVTAPTVRVTDVGCHGSPATFESISGESATEITERGVLSRPGVPYGEYAVCAQWPEKTTYTSTSTSLSTSKTTTKTTITSKSGIHTSTITSTITSTSTSTITSSYTATTTETYAVSDATVQVPETNKQEAQVALVRGSTTAPGTCS